MNEKIRPKEMKLNFKFENIYGRYTGAGVVTCQCPICTKVIAMYNFDLKEVRNIYDPQNGHLIECFYCHTPIGFPETDMIVEEGNRQLEEQMRKDWMYG